MQKSTSITKSTTPVIVLAVYKFKQPISRICFTGLSSDGSTKYNTCFDRSADRGSCTCDGNAKWHKECRHIKELRPRAQAYFESRKPVAPVIEDDFSDLIEPSPSEEIARIQQDAEDLRQYKQQREQQYQQERIKAQMAKTVPRVAETWHIEVETAAAYRRMAEMQYTA